MNVEVELAGRTRVARQVADLTADLMEPLAALAQGATAVQAAWLGVKNAIVGRVLGPLGLVSGAALGFLATLRLVSKELAATGVRGAASLERLENQFRPLLGGAARAKERIRELFQFAAKTPFRMEAIGRANRMLEVLTKGALSNREGMTLVGDAAAVAGTDFETVARAVGRLYEGLMSGRPIGEAAWRLQELGLITGDTLQKVEALRDAGAAGSEVWMVVERDLKRASGAMDTLSATLEGLESTLQDSRQLLATSFGQGFLDGEKAGTRAAIALTDAAIPAFAEFGQIAGWASNTLARFSEWMAKGVAGSRMFIPALKALVGAGTGLSAAIVGLVAVRVGSFLLTTARGAIGLSQAMRASHAATRGQTGAMAQQAVVAERLAVAQARLGVAWGRARGGQLLRVGAAVRGAGTAFGAAAQAGGMRAMALGATVAWMGLGAAIRFVAGMFRSLLAAVLSPAGLVIMAFVGIAEAIAAYGAKVAETNRRLEEMRATSIEVSEALDRQAAAVKTAAQGTELYRQALENLAKARAEVDRIMMDASEPDAIWRQAQANLEAREREFDRVSRSRPAYGYSEEQLQRARGLMAAREPNRFAGVTLADVEREFRGEMDTEAALDPRNNAEIAEAMAEIEGLKANEGSWASDRATYERLMAAKQKRLEEARNRIRAGSGSERMRLTAELANAKTPAEYQDIQRRMSELQEKFAPEDAARRDVARMEDEQRKGQADAERNFYSLRMRGYDLAVAENRMRLEQLSREEATLAKRRDLTQSERAAEQARIGAERERLRQEVAEAKRRAQEATTQAMADSAAAFKEAEAERERSEGNYERAQALEEEAALERDRAEEISLRRQAEETSMTAPQRDAWVREQMATRRRARAEQAGREAQRREEQVGEAVAERRARMLELAGQGGLTRDRAEAERRAMEIRQEGRRAGLERDYVERGFSREEAKSMADNALAMDQAQWLLDRSSPANRQVASSLRSIGGGGGVYAPEESTRYLRDAVALLRQIATNTNNNDFNPML